MRTPVGSRLSAVLHRPPVALALATIVVLGSACGRDGGTTPETERAPEPDARAQTPPRPSPDPASSIPIAPDPITSPPPAFDPSTVPRWIAAAAGAVPELNQVSLEQDIALASEVFGPGGRLLFGAGPGSPTVQVLDQPREVDPVRLALGDLFFPRGGRDVRYRETQLVHAEPATAQTVLAAVDHAMDGGPDPLLLYLGGHGEIGAEPRHNIVSLWAQSAVSVTDLATRLDLGTRPVRMVITTCFSGGFGDVVFRQADASLGASATERCGLFAAPWDLESTGCDPNPDRAAQQGYGLHFLEALRGHDRDGKSVPPGELDLDGDGRISLLEAHTRVRIVSTSADVPTSTAERWLRHAAPSEGPQQPVSLPEEDAVVEAMARRVGLSGREAEAYLELQRIDDDLEAITRALEQAQLEEDATYREATADILSRWPVLDDPWHPDQPRILDEQRDAIATHLERSPSYQAYLDARRRVDHLGQRSWELRRSSAPYERLTRALDNRVLAARLHAQGGEDWATFERILRCERGAP